VYPLAPHRPRLSDPGERPVPGVELDAFRAALARWASGVAVVAVREEGRVLATTVSAFTSASAEPPLVLVALGPGAQVLPFLTEGRRFGVSVLAESQSRLASVFADPFPVGPSPFPAEGDPVIADALVRLGCRVVGAHGAGDHVLIVGLVESAALAGGAPLIRWAREYHRLEP
jgi:flavin reductase (DIM6/NTAB) family NADH-FMN oxidoreductase RutF